MLCFANFHSIPIIPANHRYVSSIFHSFSPCIYRYYNIDSMQILGLQ